MPRYRFLLIALTIWAAGWTSYQLWPVTPEPEPKPAPRIADAEFGALEKLAVSACECRMVGGQATKCDQAYSQAKAKFEPLEGATACAPISTSMDCFGGEAERCIATEYPVVVGERGFVCTSAQAKTLDAVWSKTYQTSGQSSDKANQAVVAALKKIIDGEPIRPVVAKQGCV